MTEIKDHYLFRHALDHTNVGLIITDPSLPNHPIIFVNQGFINMTGYAANEVVGKNCRFLQGDKTDSHTTTAIRQAIDQKKSITIQVYNYKKDGTGIWNELTIDPMWIEEEKKHYFVGVQKDVTIQKEQERQLKETLDDMERLSTPIVPINKEISVLPLIGSIKHSRLKQLANTITTYLAKAQIDYLILDLSGLYEVDTYTASSISKLNDLTNLIGTQLVITGIQPKLAIKTVQVNMSNHLKQLRTYATVKDALNDLA